jgi:hypothetical protein
MADSKPTANYDYKPATVDYSSPPATANGATPQKKPSKFKEHFRRTWWLHLIIFVVSTLLISLLL